MGQRHNSSSQKSHSPPSRGRRGLDFHSHVQRDSIVSQVLDSQGRRKHVLGPLIENEDLPRWQGRIGRVEGAEGSSSGCRG